MKNRNKNFDAELAALARKRDEDIDTSDIPEIKDWSGAVVGKFYRGHSAPRTMKRTLVVLVLAISSWLEVAYALGAGNLTLVIYGIVAGVLLSILAILLILNILASSWPG